MGNWWERPTLIEEWPISIDSILTIDENGTPDLKGIKKILQSTFWEKDKLKNLEHNIFTITGVEMEREHFPQFRDLINSIKYAYWENGMFEYQNKPKRVVFHSRDIRKKQGPFNPKRINYETFLNDLSNLIEKTPFTVLSSSIDKLQHVLKYSNPYHVYTLCLEFILERYAMLLKTKNQKGMLLLESRGKREDAEILKFLVEFLKNGNNYINRQDLNCITGVYFNPKWSKLHDEKLSYPLLELTDLVSYPIHKYVKYNTKDYAFKIVEKKISRINGFGLKIFP